MHGNRNYLSRVWPQQEVGTINSCALLSSVTIGDKLLIDQTSKLGSNPAGCGQECVDVCECLNASLNCLLKAVCCVGLGEMDCGLHRCQNIPCPVFSFASENSDLLIASLAVGYVARNLRRSNDHTLSVSDWGHGQRNIYVAAVLPTTDCVIGINAFPPTDPLNNFSLFLQAITWKENSDLLTNYFFGRIAKKSLGALIPAGYYAVQIFADDRVGRGLYNGCQMLRVQLGAFSCCYIEDSDNRVLITKATKCHCEDHI
jgi:hypothetical protein